MMSETMGQFIKRRIEEIFLEAADLFDDSEMSGDEIAGVPFTIFVAQSYMLRCWDDFLSKKEDKE